MLATAGSGCGGGGGSASGGVDAPDPETPASAADPLKFSEENALESAGLVFTSGSIKLTITLDLAAAAAELHFNGLEERELACPDGGTLRLSYADHDGNGLLSVQDEVILIGESCNGADARNSLTISQLAATADWLTELGGTVVHEVQVPLASGSPVDGTHTMDVHWTDGAETWRIFDGTLGIDTSEHVGELSDLDFELRIDSNGVYTVEYSGRATSPRLGGRFSFASAQPFRGNWGGFPVEGSLVLTGADSAVQIGAGPGPIDFLSYAVYRADFDGDGQFDRESSLGWHGLGAGLLFGEFNETVYRPPQDDGNRQPDFETLEIAPTDPFTDDDVVVTATGNDPDGDAVTITYKWRRNGWVVPGQTSAIYPAGEHEKDDAIIASVRISDGRLSLLRHLLVTVQDSPTLLTVPPLSSVAPGELLRARAAISDADGDAFGSPRFALVYGPAGMTVDADTGVIEWEPSLPLFERQTDFNWRIGATDPDIAPVDGTVQVVDPERLYPLMRGGFDPKSWPTRFVAGDFDADGGVELLVLGRSLLYELAWDGSTFEQVWTYPFSFRSVSTEWPDAIAAGDVDGDGHHEIYVSADRDLFKLDGRTRKLVQRAQLRTEDGLNRPLSCSEGLEVADVDGAGRPEVVCLGDRVAVLSADLEVLWQSIDGEYGRSLAVGDVDADGALEVVTADGFVFDGATGAVEWIFGELRNDRVGIGDVDGDGVDDIVITDFVDRRIRAYDARDKVLLWDFYEPAPGPMIVRNTDADAVAEIVVGSLSSNVTVYRYDPIDDALDIVHQIESPSPRVSAIEHADVDGDGAAELVWASGEYTGFGDPVVVAGLDPDIEIEWISPDSMEMRGPYFGARLAAVAPGRQRLVFGAEGALRLIALDPDTGRLEIGDEIGYAPDSLVVSDYDLDGIDEVFFTTSRIDQPYSVFDFDAGVSEWSSDIGLGAAAATVRGDLTGDGRDDFVVLTDPDHDPSHVYVFDAYNRRQIWESDGLVGARDIDVGDLDRDGVPEVVAAVWNGLYVFARDAGGVYAETGFHPFDEIHDIAVGDTDGDAKLEVYVLGNSDIGLTDRVYCLDAELQLLRVLELGESARSVHIEELGHARKNLALYLGNRGPSGAPVFSVRDPTTGAEIFRSPELNGYVAPNAVSYVDVDGDGVREMVFATDAGVFLTR